MIVVGQARQGPQVGLGLPENPLELGRPVADLEHRHPDAGEGHQVVLRLLEHRLGQHRGAGAEVVHAVDGWI